MIQQLEKAISKLSQLSESEQEKIAQMIMTTIENKKEEKNGYIEDDPLAELRNSDFIGCFAGESDLAEKSAQIAKNLSNIRSETALLSESSLAKDWLTEEEDKAWENF